MTGEEVVVLMVLMVAGFVERVMKGIKVRLRSRLLLSIRLCNGCLTPFSCDGGITTPVLWGTRGGAGRRFPCPAAPCGIIRFGWSEGVLPLTEGVRASLWGYRVFVWCNGGDGGGVGGFRRGGTREGGLLEGDAVIWF